MLRRSMTYRHCQPRTRSVTPLARLTNRLGFVLIWCLRQAFSWGLRVPGALAIIGVLMRLSIRDRVETIAYLHYGTPWSVIGLLALAAALISWLQARWNRRNGSGAPGVLRLASRWGFTGLALLAALAWWFSDFERGQTAANVDGEGGPVMRVVLWNAEGNLRWPGLLEALHDADPDILLVVESGRISLVRDRLKQVLGENCQTWSPGGQMLVTSRESMSPDPGSQREGGWWNYDHLNRFVGFTTRFEGRPVRILGVDVYSRPLNKRSIAAGHAARMGREDDVPTIVLGDFNTPADSVWFEAMREDFDHAFELAGDGYSPTWPEPVPLLQIDHVWLERGAFEVVQVQQIDTGVSDHRMLVVDVQFVEHLNP